VKQLPTVLQIKMKHDYLFCRFHIAVVVVVYL